MDTADLVVMCLSVVAVQNNSESKSPKLDGVFPSKIPNRSLVLFHAVEYLFSKNSKFSSSPARGNTFSRRQQVVSHEVSRRYPFVS